MQNCWQRPRNGIESRTREKISCSPPLAAQPAGHTVHAGLAAGGRGQPALHVTSISVRPTTYSKSVQEFQITVENELTICMCCCGSARRRRRVGPSSSGYRQLSAALHQQEVDGVARRADTILRHHNHLRCEIGRGESKVEVEIELRALVQLQRQRRRRTSASMVPPGCRPKMNTLGSRDVLLQQRIQIHNRGW